MERKTATLILVYNADGGVLNALGDMVRKIISPATYPCALCALTYGPFAMRGAWRRFIDGLGMPILFLYRDEFREHLDQRDIALATILLAGEAGPPEMLVNAAELDALPDLSALIALVEERLAFFSA